MTTLPDVFRLDGRVVIVTGAASGIGQATARRLQEAGATVVGADIADGEHVTTRTDVSERSQMEDLVAGAASDHGRLDGMVNVAGIIRTAELTELDETELDLLLGVNLKGTVFGTQAALRAMRDSGGGSIVNVSSAAIDMPTPGYGAYAMSKAGVAMLTRTAAAEGGKHGIRVNAVAPGFIDTPMTARWYGAPEGGADEATRVAFLEMLAKRTPLGVTGVPDDIAWAILYLVSDASRFVTGQILRPNGGTVMPW